ncbi:MAG: TonB-dependent receptor, partial [Bacteroidota bacterium]
NGFGRVEVVYGGESAEWGSGAVSGGIHLHAKAPSEGFKAGLYSSYGSFDQLSRQLDLSIGKEKWGARLSAQFDDAQNDFPFQLSPDLPVQQLSNAAFEQQITQQQLYWHPSQKHYFEFNAWQQQTDRNIPPTTVQNRSLASQSDRIWRQTLHWKGIFKNSQWNGRVAYFREEIVYRDDLIGLVAPSDFDTYLIRLDRSQNWRDKWIFKTGLHFQYAEAIADGYAQEQQQTQVALYQQAQFYFHPHWTAKATVRFEKVIEGENIPSFDIELNHDLTKHSQVYASWSRDFRLPTLNDRFWAVGGKPDLATEFSWNQSLGFRGNTHHQNHRLHYEIEWFNRNVDDWIQWSQQENTNLWSADNVAEVWSRGVASHLKWVIASEKAQLSTTLRHQWVKSTYETTIINPDIPKGTQLWYTPEHQLSGGMSYQRPHWQISYQQQWTAETNGINDDLPAFSIANLRGECKLGRKFQSTLFAQCNNLWDTQYRVIERRVMPGRHFRVGLALTFHHKKLNNKQSYL